MTLIEALKARPGSTAKQLAKLMRVSVPTVYRRIAALQDSGVLIAMGYAPAIKGKTGPRSVTFQMVIR